MEEILKDLANGQQDAKFVPLLEDLHRKRLAAPEHTTLLLNAYIRDRDEAKIDAFVKTAGSTRTKSDYDQAEEIERPLPGTNDFAFDVPSAVNALRAARYFTQAAALALRFDQHDDYISIYDEELNDPAEVVFHLETLPPADCSRLLTRCMRHLLKSDARDATTNLLTLLWGGRYRPKARFIGVPTKSVTANETDSSRMRSYLRYIPLGRRGDTPATTLESSVDNAVQAIQQATVPQYEIPSLRLFQPYLIEFSEAHIEILETVAEMRYNVVLDPSLALEHEAEISKKRGRDPETAADLSEKSLLWETLLDLYLDQGSRQKALAILKSDQTIYDYQKAQLICSLAHFQAGQIYLMEQKGQFLDILRLSAQSSGADPLVDACLASSEGDRVSNSCLKALYRYRGLQPDLNVEFLNMLVASPDLLKDVGDDILLGVVEEIDGKRLLTFLEIVRTLSRTKLVSVGMIRGWLIDRLSQNRDEQAVNEKLADSYRQSNISLQARLKEFNNPKHPKIIQEDTCAACHKRLDLPTIHFLCGHSFHQRCLEGNARDCPIDYEAVAKVRSLNQTQRQIADDQGQFFYHLENAKDKKAAIIEHGFGKGLMTFVSNLDSASNPTTV